MRDWITAEFDALAPPAIDPDAYGTVRRPPPLPTITVHRASDFADKPLPCRPWLVPDLIPDCSVTILGGDGGVGKSLLALQLATATATATDWIGTLPEPGAVLYVSAEDDSDEIHRRLADIVGSNGLELSDLENLHLLPLADMDAVLATSDGRGLIAATGLWKALAAKIAEIRPRLVILDNLADVFAGNENARPEARQFIGLLRGAAIEHGLAVVLIAHPSLNGIASGTGTSGSTAWNASVRSRLYLDRAKSEDGDEPDPTLRVLRLMKANYAPTGTEVRLQWNAGRFKLNGLGAGSFDRMAAEQKAERVFLDLLKRHQDQGRDVTFKPSRTYAPTVFARDPDSEGIGSKVFERAMNLLLREKRIVADTFGPPSKPRTRIIFATFQEASE